jgi:DNA-binding PadR family transcriptional regulator
VRFVLSVCQARSAFAMLTWLDSSDTMEAGAVCFMASDRLSEIEACVLALVSADGPATPYAIRKVFLDSPSPQWSGSAGTIYPLVERLLRRKLIRSKLCLTGKRRGYQISLTAAGSRALRSWLSFPIPEWVAGVPPDPLRTRVRFLSAVGANHQRAFLQKAHRQTQAHLRVVEGDCERQRAKGGFQYLMARGALLSMQSRCAFLQEVADALDVRLKNGLRVAKDKRTARRKTLPRITSNR